MLGLRRFGPEEHLSHPLRLELLLDPLGGRCRARPSLLSRRPTKVVEGLHLDLRGLDRRDVLVLGHLVQDVVDLLEVQFLASARDLRVEGVEGLLLFLLLLLHSLQLHLLVLAPLHVPGMEVLAVLSLGRLVRRVEEAVLHVLRLQGFGHQRWVEGALFLKLLLAELLAHDLVFLLLSVPAQAPVLHLFLVLVGQVLFLHGCEVQT